MLQGALEHWEVWEFGEYVSWRSNGNAPCNEHVPSALTDMRPRFHTNSRVYLAPILVTCTIATAIADLSHMPKLSVSGLTCGMLWGLGFRLGLIQAPLCKWMLMSFKVCTAICVPHQNVRSRALSFRGSHGDVAIPNICTPAIFQAVMRLPLTGQT